LPYTRAETLGNCLFLLLTLVGSSTLSDATSRSPSPARAPLRLLGAVAFVGLALLGLAVKLALLPKRRGAGASAVIWGVLFGAYLWWGSHQVGLREWKAELLGILGGLATALVVYLRGASLDRPPADRPGAFLGRFAAKRKRTTAG
jgi:peptidoglycan/LPS O-acetylase OafA/YrhL